MKHLAVKALLTSVLVLAFALMVLSGALLYFGKTGLVWGMPRYIIRSAHAATAVLLCIVVPTHLILNRRTYKAEIRALIRKSGSDGTTEKKG